MPFFFKQRGGVRKSKAGRDLEGEKYDSGPRRLELEFPKKSGHRVKLYSVCSYPAGDTYPGAAGRRRVP